MEFLAEFTKASFLGPVVGVPISLWVSIKVFNKFATLIKWKIFYSDVPRNKMIVFRVKDDRGLHTVSFGYVDSKGNFWIFDARKMANMTSEELKNNGMLQVLGKGVREFDGWADVCQNETNTIQDNI